jgi:hypothetical protein
MLGEEDKLHLPLLVTDVDVNDKEVIVRGSQGRFSSGLF